MNNSFLFFFGQIKFGGEVNLASMLSLPFFVFLKSYEFEYFRSGYDMIVG